MDQCQGRNVSRAVAEMGDGESYESIELGAASPGTPGEICDESWLEVVPVGVMVEGSQDSIIAFVYPCPCKYIINCIYLSFA